MSGSISWSPGAWGDGTTYSVDITSIIQAVVNRENYTQGDYVLLLISNQASYTGAYRQFSSVDYNSGAEKPSLSISYVEAAGDVDLPILEVEGAGHVGVIYGSMSLPVLTATGQTNLIGKGSMSIPAVTVDIRAGLRQSLTLPKLTATATASQTYRSSGVCTLPKITATGRTGASGDCSIPMLQASGATGASGYVVLPGLTTDTSGTSRILVEASMRITAARCTGTALVGAVGQGVV